jgi:hypothetical protein
MESRYLSRIALISFLAAPTFLAAGTVMKMAVFYVSPFPDEGEEVLLKGRVYDQERRRVSSVRLDVGSEEETDPVRSEWTFTGSNSSGQNQRVNLTCTLLDENDKPIASGRKTIFLKAGTEEQKETLKMKVRLKVWEAAKKGNRVKIQADFATLR